ncbi:MAG: acetyl-CoA carboxylase biotin carboxyl carrier protein subunit, partial [Thermoanaerobaculia bacterium]
MRLRDLRTGEERDAASLEVPAGATAVREGDVAWVFYRGETYRLSSVSATRTRRAARGVEETSPLEAPMPGRILSVRVAAGSAVAKGDVLVVVGAMKMEH